MSDATLPPARPVSLVTTFFVLALLMGFYFVVRHYYSPTASSPQNAAAENLPKELEWKATNATRRAALQELKEAEAKQAVSYGWVDQKAGVVQLPIERAMQLTAEKYRAKK
jgi:hypothetical protein